MNKLPREIITDILSRLSIRYLVRCRNVCKVWHDIVSDPSLLSIITSRTNNNSYITFTSVPAINWKRRLTFRFSNSLDTTLVLTEYSENKVTSYPIITFKNLQNPVLPNPSSFHYDAPRVMGISKNGLACLLSHYTASPPNDTGGYFIYTYNLITGEYKELPDIGFLDNIFETGLGYGVSSKKLKAIMIPAYNQNLKFNKEVCVHELDSNGWISKILNDVPIDLLINIGSCVYIINGSHLHWMTTSSDRRLMILALDMCPKKFRIISAPEGLSHFNTTLDVSYQYTLGMLEGCLSLVDCSSRDVFNIWLFKNFDEKKPWVMKYSIQKSPCFNKIGSITIVSMKLPIDDEILLMCNDDFYVSYNTQTKSCRPINS